MDVRDLQKAKEQMVAAVRDVREKGLVANDDERPEFALQTVLGVVPHLPGMIESHVPETAIILTPEKVREMLRAFAIEVMHEQIDTYALREEAIDRARQRARAIG